MLAVKVNSLKVLRTPVSRVVSAKGGRIELV